jgi:hypothetical protein
MNYDSSIQRLRNANPVTATALADDALLAEIVSLPGDPRIRATSRWIRRRPVLAMVAAAVVMACAVGGGIAAVGLFKTPAQEEQGLPNGSAMFIGTHPTCTTVSNEQFHCVLESKPTVEYIEGSYLGSKMLSVDTTKHIDGGCIATTADGLTWDCYLGQAAVDHEILAATLLGQYLPGPSHG